MMKVLRWPALVVCTAAGLTACTLTTQTSAPVDLGEGRYLLKAEYGFRGSNALEAGTEAARKFCADQNSQLQVISSVGRNPTRSTNTEADIIFRCLR
jgi:hypothetical protein